MTAAVGIYILVCIYGAMFPNVFVPIMLVLMTAFVLFWGFLRITISDEDLKKHEEEYIKNLPPTD